MTEFQTAILEDLRKGGYLQETWGAYVWVKSKGGRKKGISYRTLDALRANSDRMVRVLFKRGDALPNGRVIKLVPVTAWVWSEWGCR